MKTKILIVLISLGVIGCGVLFLNKKKDAPIVEDTVQKQVVEDAAVGEVVAQADSFDIHKIAIGDGKVSNGPKAGYVFACQQNFRTGVASHGGDWIYGSTWDVTEKLAVIGEVHWNDAFFSDKNQGAKRIISANGLPVGSPTGNFPIARNDPAYQLDRNPNGISSQDVAYSLPLNPVTASNPACVPMGAIGIALNGVAIYNALDDAGEDAVAHEVQDACNGHPQKVGEYHYHGPSDCIVGADESNTLIGYALDGFGIYSKFDTEGHRYTNTDLDACHGMKSEVLWNGEVQDVYHYVMTEEYPYTLGCFTGTPVRGKR